MNTRQITDELEQALAQLPVLDIHTHLVGGKLGARGLHDVLLYHMAVSDLYAAGCPTGARLTQYPGWPTREEAHHRIEEALPYLPLVRNTGISHAVRVILRDLYAWNQPVTADNWRKLDDLIRERADDRAWAYGIIDRLNIQRTVTEIARREHGEDDHRLRYSLEWCFFTRCQWGEHDTALYELERCWGLTPSSPSPIGGGTRPATPRTIRSLDDVKAAVKYYVDTIPYDQVVSTATHISTDIDFQSVADDDMAKALACRGKAGTRERDVYASYVNELFLTELEKHEKEIVFQFSFAAEPLPYETASRISQRTIAQLAEMIGRHPKLRFQCFLASRHANQSICTLARELPNLSVAGFWWHNFQPDVIRQMIAERLDMLPVNKQMGFFSDAYCAEWVYGKMAVVRKQMARVLADKIEEGQYSFDDAVSIAGDLLFTSPQTMFKLA
ncbi:MAG: hypothetical protein IT440_05160 [Phycisphaeraceae bacterium]|nr:hypothetical protein [Phycisphaeraceae bacterium]